VGGLSSSSPCHCNDQIASEGKETISTHAGCLFSFTTVFMTEVHKTSCEVGKQAGGGLALEEGGESAAERMRFRAD